MLCSACIRKLLDSPRLSATTAVGDPVDKHRHGRGASASTTAGGHSTPRAFEGSIMEEFAIDAVRCVVTAMTAVLAGSSAAGHDRRPVEQLQSAIGRRARRGEGGRSPW